MKNTNLYLLAKKIHRVLVLIILVTGIFMMVTGVCMYLGQYFTIDPLLIRYLHNKLSILFAIVLGVMMITGAYLFLFPYLSVKSDTE